MKIILAFLILCSVHATAEEVPEHLREYLKLSDRSSCVYAEIDKCHSTGNKQEECLYFGIYSDIETIREHSFNVLNAYEETFTPSYSIKTVGAHTQVLELTLYEIAHGRTSIKLGVDKYVFTVLKDIDSGKIVSAKRVSFRRGRTIFGGLKKTWKEEQSPISCSDL